MKTPVTFFKCNVCENMVALIKKGVGELVCCGQPMVELKGNTTEASYEKHIPVAVRENGQITVQVGSEIHPMTEKHYIEWIALVNNEGCEIISLAPGEEPKAVFCNKENVDVYAYCNLHGLWKSELK